MSKSTAGGTATGTELSPTTGAAGEETTVEDSSPDEKRSTGVSTDEAFKLLSNRRRRFALHHLKNEGPEISLGDLSEQVAAWENGKPVERVSADERKSTYTSLQQFHLPKLDEKGIVEYDERAKIVELTEASESMQVYLEVISEKDVPWSQYYLGLAGFNATVAGAMLANVWPAPLLADSVWVVFIVTTIVVSALVHYYESTRMKLGSTDRPPELRQ